MRVLLLGGSGQVGQALAARSAGAWDLRRPARTELDLLAPDLETRVAELGPAIVVNAAAMTDVDGAERDPAGCHAVNAEAPAKIARACAAAGAVLIHLSTDFVFSGELGRAYREDDAPGPVNAYGAAKLAAEAAIARAGAAAIVVRTSWVYSLERPSFVSRTIERARHDEELVAADDQLGSPTWAAELARALEVLVGSLAGDPLARAQGLAGVYHLAGSGSASRYDLTREILEGIRGRPGIVATRVRPVPSASFVTIAKRPRDTPLDCEKAERVLGLELAPWREALARALG